MPVIISALMQRVFVTSILKKHYQSSQNLKIAYNLFRWMSRSKLSMILGHTKVMIVVGQLGLKIIRIRYCG